MYPNIKKLKEIKQFLMLSPQTPEREKGKFEIEQQIKILELNREIKVAEYSLFLFNSYFKNGMMRVKDLKNNNMIEGNPKITGNPIYDVWKVRSESLRLSNLVYKE